jgi:hypothetical protein
VYALGYSNPETALAGALLSKSFFGNVEVDDLGAEVIGGDFEQADGDGEAEAGVGMLYRSERLGARRARG